MPRKEEEIVRLRALQLFDVKKWIESEVQELDHITAIAELVDNALDETPDGEVCKFNISVDSHNQRVTFENKNTFGMDADKMNEYTLWGGKHMEAGQIKEHRLGGKLAALFFLSHNSGTLKISSKPRNGSVLYEMNMGNWWENLTAGFEFAVDTVDTLKPEPHGWTRFTIEGVDQQTFHNLHLVDIVEQLGLLYGPLIEANKLDINLQFYSHNSTRVERKQVLPITIPLREGFKEEKDGIPLGKKGKGPHIKVSWGMIDQDEKKNRESMRKGYYETQTVNTLEGDRVYYYYHGRLLSVVPLSRLKIPGYTRKHVFDSFVVLVDITSGWAPKTILKTSLAPSSDEALAINEKVISLTTNYITRLTSENEEEVPQRFFEKTKEADIVLSAVLNKLYDNDPQKIAEIFHLPMNSGVFKSFSNEEDQKRKPTSPSKPGLPGGRSPKEISEQPKGIRSRESHQTWINPIPEFRVVRFSENYPEGTLSIDEESGRPVIELNFSSPIVKLAFQLRGKPLVGELLRIGASILSSEKNLDQFKDNAVSYNEAVQRDVSVFMETAMKLGLV